MSVNILLLATVNDNIRTFPSMTQCPVSTSLPSFSSLSIFSQEARELTMIYKVLISNHFILHLWKKLTERIGNISKNYFYNS